MGSDHPIVPYSPRTLPLEAVLEACQLLGTQAGISLLSGCCYLHLTPGSRHSLPRPASGLTELFPSLSFSVYHADRGVVCNGDPTRTWWDSLALQVV